MGKHKDNSDGYSDGYSAGSRTGRPNDSSGWHIPRDKEEPSTPPPLPPGVEGYPLGKRN